MHKKSNRFINKSVLNHSNPREFTENDSLSVPVCTDIYIE